MQRSFSNRILGGVCGGFASSTRLNAWLWRIAFILLAILTLGAGAAAYVLLWWSLPLGSPIRRSYGGAARSLLAVLLSLAVIIAWFLRGRIFPVELYWPVLLVLLALVLLLKQLAAGRQGNIALALVGLAVALVMLLGTAHALPVGLYDIAWRSWPALLVFFGLSIMLRYRMPFGSWIALLMSAVLVAGVATMAFNSRVDTQRDDQQISIDEAISEAVTTLQVNVETRDTDVRIQVATEAAAITGEFSGSNNSHLNISYEEQEAIATFTLQERYMSEFPLLEDVGRSNLNLRIPPNIAVAVAFAGDRGAMEFDMASLNLERLNLTVTEGNALVTLPDYEPLSPSVRENPGVWTLFGGDLRVVVPETVGARFLLDRSRNTEPRPGETHDDLNYRVELAGNDFVLVSRRYDALDTQVEYRINVNGRLEVDTTSADG